MLRGRRTEAKEQKAEERTGDERRAGGGGTMANLPLQYSLLHDQEEEEEEEHWQLFLSITSLYMIKRKRRRKGKRADDLSLLMITRRMKEADHPIHHPILLSSPSLHPSTPLSAALQDTLPHCCTHTHIPLPFMG